jgi:hypothetical protein
MVLGTFSAPTGPYGIAFDGTYMWVSAGVFSYVFRASDGVMVAFLSLQAGGVAFDGAYVWTAQTNGNRVLKF